MACLVTTQEKFLLSGFAQQDLISFQIQGDISKLRADATTTVDNERVRLANIVKDIRTTQISALKDLRT